MLPHARFLSRSRRSWLTGALRSALALPAAWLTGRALPAAAQTAPPFTTTFAPTPPPTFLPTLPPGTLPPLTPPPTFFTQPPGGGGANPVPAPAAAAVFGSGLAAMAAWLWGRGIRERLRALIERLARLDGR